MYYKQIYCPRRNGASYEHLFEKLLDSVTHSQFLVTRKTLPNVVSPIHGIDGTDVWIAWTDDWSECTIFNDEIRVMKTLELSSLFSFLKENIENEISSKYTFEANIHDFLLKDGRVISVTLELFTESIHVRCEDGCEINIK